MRTFQQAREMASEELGLAAKGFVLLDDVTQEREEGWLFFFQSEQYVATGDRSVALAGNNPLLVPRDGSAPFVFDHRKSWEENLLAHQSCGDAHAQPNPEVLLCGWKSGATSVSAIKALRSAAHIGLGEAKRVVDDCLNGQTATIRTRDVACARALISTLESLGFIAQVTYGQRP